MTVPGSTPRSFRHIVAVRTVSGSQVQFQHPKLWPERPCAVLPSAGYPRNSQESLKWAGNHSALARRRAPCHADIV